MKQFVPITDDLLYRRGGPPGPLVPYRAGIACGRPLGSESETAVAPAPASTPGDGFSASPPAYHPA